MGVKFSFCYQDKSSLSRAWEDYYGKMGLSYNKMLRKVNERVHKGKFPDDVHKKIL